MSVHMRSRTAGFSFIEIVIAVMILGILTLAVGPYLTKWIGTASYAATENNLRDLKLAIQQYNLDTGKYPQTLSELYQRPATVKNWRGPYIDPENSEKATSDGWKVSFVYQPSPAGGKGGRPYQLYSWGANKEGSDQSEWIQVWDV